MNLKIKFWLFSSVLLVFILIFFGLGTLYFINYLPSTISEYLSLIIYRYLQAIFFSTFFFILFYLFVSFIIYTKYIVPFYVLTEEAKLISKVNPSHRINIKGCKEVCDLSKEVNKLAEVIESSCKRFEDELTKHIHQVLEKKVFLEHILNTLPFGVLVCDLNGVLFFYNHRAKVILSNATGCLLSIGKNIFECFKNKENKKFKEAINNLKYQKDQVSKFVFVEHKLRDYKVIISGLPLEQEKKFDKVVMVIEGSSIFKEKRVDCLCSLEELLYRHELNVKDIEHFVEIYDTCACVDVSCFCEEVKELWEKSLEELPYTVFDLETTGLDPFGGDEIVSISAVRVVRSKILIDEVFHQLVNPNRDIPQTSVRIHGITSEMVKDKPSVEEGLKLFYQYAKGTVLVGYNAFFDKAFLYKKEAKAGIKFENPILDVLLLSVLVHPHQKDHSLESIAKRLGAKIYPRHTSYGDALTCAEILVKLFPLLKDRRIFTLKDAWKQMQKIKFYSKEYLSIIPA